MKRFRAFTLYLGISATFILSSGLLFATQPVRAETITNTLMLASPTIKAQLTPTATVVAPQSTSGSFLQALSAFFNSPLGIAILTITIGALLTAYLTYFFTRRAKKKEAEETEAKAAKVETERKQQEAASLLTIRQTETQRTESAVQSYRNALLHDSTIAFIQILDMSKPIELVNVYVQLRLNKEPRTTYDTDLLAGKKRQQFDPNIELREMRKLFEDIHASKVIDPVQAIRENTQCVLLGDPGAGKTTLLKYLTIQASKKGLTGLPELPIYIELSKFAESGSQSLLDFVLIQWEQIYRIPQDDIRPFVEEQDRTGKILWLLDALDETGIGKTPEERNASYKRVSDAIMRIATPLPKAPVVVTARIAGYRQRAPLAGFTELEVMQLRPEDTTTFITNWFDSPDAARAQMGVELNEKLEGNIRIQTLAANPLLLSLIVLLREKNLKIPELRVELYEQCVKLLLIEWAKTKRNVQTHPALWVDQQEILLQNIAWQFHTKNVRYLDDDEIVDTIATFLASEQLSVGQKRDVLEEIATNNGLLKAQAEHWYGFLHLTFQEYFTALYVDRNKLLDNLLQHRNDPWWEEVILLYAGSTREIAPMLKKLLRQDNTCLLEDDIYSTNIVLAGRCLAARPPAKMEQAALLLKQEVIQHLFEILLNTPYSLSRKQAAETLTELGRTEIEVTNHLLQLLTDKNTNVQVAENIARAFGDYGERSLAIKMLSAFFDEKIDEGVKGTISYALEKLRNKDVESALITKILNKNEEDLTRMSAINAISAKIMRSHASELFALLLDRQESTALRFSLALVWRNIDDTTTARELFTQTTSAQVDDVSKTMYIIALSALAHLDHPTLSALLAFSTDPSSSLDNSTQYIVLSNIMHSLHNATFDNYFVHIIKEKPSTLVVRKRLVEFLRITNHETIKAELQRLYADPDIEQELHEEIGFTLYMLGDRSVVLDTVKLLTQAQEFGSFESYIVEQMDVSTQLQMLTNTKLQYSIRVGIVGVIADAGNKTAVPMLSEIALNKKTVLDVRVACIKALGTLADDAATAKILAELVNEPQTSDQAQQALWFVSRRARIRIIKDPLTKQVHTA